MSKVTCDYHPSREAVTKCERCNRLICLQDKQVIRRNSHHGFHSHSMFDGYSEIILCPLCYYDQSIAAEKLVKSVGGFQKMIVIGFALFFLIPLFFMFKFISEFNNVGLDSGVEFLPIVFGFFFLFVIVFMVTMIFKGTSKIQNISSNERSRALTRKNQFLQSVENESFLEKYKNAELVCFQCGARIEKSDLFCSSCGDSTADELSS